MTTGRTARSPFYKKPWIHWTIPARNGATFRCRSNIVQGTTVHPGLCSLPVWNLSFTASKSSWRPGTGISWCLASVWHSHMIHLSTILRSSFSRTPVQPILQCVYRSTSCHCFITPLLPANIGPLKFVSLSPIYTYAYIQFILISL